MSFFDNQFCRIVLLASGIATLGYAQASRTWVSGVGDDANPCSRTAPCKTFAGAISKTAAGGEIAVLDPGGYGAVTITKAITINGDDSLAGILVSGTNGIVVNAGASDLVTIRNISFNGISAGLSGILFLAGGTLVVDKCSIYGFTQRGIDVSLTNNGNLVVNDTKITGGATGIRLNTTAGRLNASLDHVSIRGATTGVDAMAGFTVLSNSIVSMNSSFGLLSENSGILTAESSMLTTNGTAAQANTGSMLRVSNVDLFDNLTGFGCGGGTIASAGNNRKFGNTGGPPTCNPTVSVPMQ